MLQSLKSMPRRLKWATLLFIDVAFVPVALLCANVLQFNDLSIPETSSYNWVYLSIVMVTAFATVLSLRTHKIQLKAYETRAVSLTAIQSLVLLVICTILGELFAKDAPLSFFVNFGLIYFVLTVSIRVILLQILLTIYRLGNAQTKVVIYGAGATGRQLAAGLKTDPTIRAVAFVDDNASLHGLFVRGLKVHPPMALRTMSAKRSVERVLLAMPSMSNVELVRISKSMKELGLHVETLPSFAQLVNGESLYDQLKPVKPLQVLGRETVGQEFGANSERYQGKVLMITGAAGSIGSELCRQVLQFGPSKVVLFEQNEFGLYSIDKEIRSLIEQANIEVVSVLGSVSDSQLLRRVVRSNDVNVVLHAAAYKHVTIVEQNIVVGVQNNLLGTINVADIAFEEGVDRFILISTDKAVNPINAMGASKRLAEIYIQYLSNLQDSAKSFKTVFTTVRFGNVLGSSGSVLPLFEDQISKGGPVTVTHVDATRFFMTIPEAARLVLLAGTSEKSGEIYALDMGEPVRIYDLAKRMIEMKGLQLRDGESPDGDIEIRFTGLRPGEKIHELISNGDRWPSELHEKIWIISEPSQAQKKVVELIDKIKDAVQDYDTPRLKRLLLDGSNRNLDELCDTRVTPKGGAKVTSIRNAKI